LTQDIPGTGLVVGDVGVIVHIHGQGAAYEVEFMTLDGGAPCVETLEAKQIRAAGNCDAPHVHQRLLALIRRQRERVPKITR
jgi:hypothetical protein